MNHSLAVIVSFLLLNTYCCASASVIPNKKAVVYKTFEEFIARIRESGTKFVERINVDEKNGLETFYDFKNKILVNRVKSEASCFLRPLPNTLRKSANLKTGLQRASQTRSPGQPLLVKNYYWVISGQVNKTLLSQEVRDFCGQFPVFRLQKYHLNSATGLGKRNVGGTRLARGVTFRHLPICDLSSFPTCTNIKTDPCCKPENWKYNIKVRTRHCTYWVNGCKLDTQIQSITCPGHWNHVYSSMVCVELVCP